MITYNKNHVNDYLTDKYKSWHYLGSVGEHDYYVKQLGDRPCDVLLSIVYGLGGNEYKSPCFSNMILDPVYACTSDDQGYRTLYGLLVSCGYLAKFKTLVETKNLLQQDVDRWRYAFKDVNRDLKRLKQQVKNLT